MKRDWWWAPVVAIAAVLVLAGCDSANHKGEHCIAHNTVLIPMVHMVGKVPVTTYIYEDECSQWVPDNPATVKP